MADGGSGEKTEKASPKRRKDERKKGNVFVSKDVTTLISLVVSFFTLKLFVTSFLSQIQDLYRAQMARVTYMEQVTMPEIMTMFRDAASVFATTVLPVMLVVGATAIAITMFQTKLLVTTESMKFKLDRLSILKGIKKMFSLRSVVELTKSILKVILITWLLYGKVRAVLDYLPMMIDWELYQAASYTGDQIMSLIISVAIAFSAIAAVDYVYQWWEYEKNIRMTKQEIKDEYKNMEGNPEVKGARKQKQRELSQKRMMQQVPDADVIVRNPTHYAVALKYDMDADMAPIVLARGKDRIALKIIEIAEAHHIDTVENRPLARSLYELSNVNDIIPAEFFQPVAELLAWLYSTKEKDKQMS